MKFRVIFAVIVVLLVISGVVLFVNNQAPETSNIELASCVQSQTGDCVRFPTVSGETLNGDAVTFPDVFTGEYNLVIVPFNREQQESVLDWLPFAQELQADYGIPYYSVAALPDLPAGVRLLISGGMRLAVDETVRAVSALLYLEDQSAFADALNVDNLDEMHLFILDAQGDVLWSIAGMYSDELAQQVREQVGILVGQA